MPILFQYLLKLSCSLAVVCLFYQLLLRRLTFYAANRWYLFCFSALCFLMPLIDISGLVGQHRLNGSNVVRLIPTIGDYATGRAVMVQKAVSPSLSLWNVCVLILASGSLVLLARLLIQYFSYRHLRKSAHLLTSDGITIYGVANNISPFSFGNAIFINQHGHSEAELREIIRHEFVHVTQRHTLDIIWMEILCILNWYNPFAWGLRHAVRQNLEFIADSHVIQSGIDKKEYQYLLLKVMGAPQFRIASSFNFSSLKKRIVMINKMPSTKAHLVKFLLAVPLVVVLLVAFRNNENKNAVEQTREKTITISGLVVNAIDHEPLNDVSIKDAISKSVTTTDQRGFFSIDVPANQYPVQTELTFEKKGFIEQLSKSSIKSKTGRFATGLIEIVGMAAPPNDKKVAVSFLNTIPLFTDNPSVNIKASYEDVLKHFEQVKKHWTTQDQLQKASANSEKPYWVINGRPFVVSRGGSWASTDELTDVVFVDGKRLTGEEVNKTLKRSSIKTVGAMEGEAAKKKYGLAQPVLELYITTNPVTDTVPAPPRVMEYPIADTVDLPESYQAFAKRNPMVEIMVMEQEKVIIVLKSGKRETYNLKDKKSSADAEKKYGKLPVAPPPPPPMIEEPISVTENELLGKGEVESLRMQIAELNKSLHNNNYQESAKALRLELQKRSAALQKEQQALQSYLQEKQAYLQEKQVASLQKHKALLVKMAEKQAAFQKEQKALQLQLQEKQAAQEKHR